MQCESLCYVNAMGIVPALRSYSTWEKYLCKQAIKYAVMSQVQGATGAACNRELEGKGFLQEGT